SVDLLEQGIQLSGGLQLLDQILARGPIVMLLLLVRHGHDCSVPLGTAYTDHLTRPADAICAGTSCHRMIHARFSDAAVMKIPRSRNARGLCCCASSRKIAGTSGNQPSVTRRGSPAHSGASHPSRSARWSASAAQAASSSHAPAGAGSSSKTFAPRCSDPRWTAEE